MKTVFPLRLLCRGIAWGSLFGAGLATAFAIVLSGRRDLPEPDLATISAVALGPTEWVLETLTGDRLECEAHPILIIVTYGLFLIVAGAIAGVIVVAVADEIGRLRARGKRRAH